LDRSSSSSLLCMNIQRHAIGLAVVSSQEVTEPTRLSPIPTRGRPITQDCIEQLHQVVMEHEIHGFVVSWPIQRDTGKIGAPCGRVLFTLESILEKHNEKNAILTPSRPACLWDSRPLSEQLEEEDEWGRCPSYGRPCYHKTMHRASEEQYYTTTAATEDSTVAATQMWDDFCRVHWPQRLGWRRIRKTQTTAKQSLRGASCRNLVADWKNGPQRYAQAATAAVAL
jgi:hypothetical protein